MLPPGVYHEAIVEGRVLTCSAPQSRPELLLAEGNRVIRDHRLSRMMAGRGVPRLGGAGPPAGLAAFYVPVEE